MEVSVIPFLNAHRGQSRIPQEIVVGIIHHILPDDHAQFVTLVIEFFHLHLNVFPEGIESQLFHGQDIIHVAFRSRRCQKAFRPVTLVQQSVEEIRLSVETQPGIAVDVLYFQ